MRTLCLSLIAVVPLVVGCPSHQNVECRDNTSCDISSGGACFAATTGNMWCAYPDPGCPSGFRYSNQDVGDGVGGQCVPDTIDAGVDAPQDGTVPAADWATRHGGPGDDTGTAVAVAPNGDVVMVGSFSDTMTLGGGSLSSNGGIDAWVARYHADGSHVWSTHFGGIGYDTARNVAVDANGDVYVVGQFTGPVDFGGGSRTNATGGFLVKLDGSTGAHAWDQVFGATTADITGGVAVLDATTVAIAGRFTATTNFGGGNVTATPSTGFDTFAAAYNLVTGAHVWSRALSTTGSDGEFGGIVAVGGDVVISAGYFGTATLGGTPLTSSGNAEDIFVVRLHGSDGAHIWSVGHGGTSADYPTAVQTDGTHVFVGGRFLGTSNFGGSMLTSAGSFDAFLAAYNADDGTHVWSVRFGGMNDNEVTSIAASSTRVAATISFFGPLTIGTQTFTADHTDVAIARVNATSGVPITAVQFGSPADDTMAIAYTADRLTGVGTFSTSTSLFGTQLTSDGGTDIASFRVDF